MYLHTRNSTFKNTESNIDFHWFNGSSNLHTHAYYELFIIIHGEFTHTYKGVERVLSPGDAVLVTPKNEHLLLAKSKHNLHANFSITEHAFKNLTKSYNLEFYDYLKATSGTPFHLNSNEIQFLTDSLNSMYSINDSKSIDYFYLSIFHLLLGSFIVQKSNPTTELILPDWLKEFLNKLASPQFFCLPMKEIYAMSNYSQSRFINLFKRHLNMTPITYINNLKINYAKKLLEATNYDLLYISNELGFSSYSYFSTFFKRSVGMSPSTYREKSYITINEVPPESKQND